MGDGGENWRWCFFGGVEAESSPEDYHFRGDRTQNDEDISRSLTLKPSIYIHDLSEIIFMYTVYPYHLTVGRLRILRSTERLMEFVISVEFQ